MREQSGAFNPKHQSPTTKFCFFLGKQLLAQIAHSSKSTLVSFPPFTTKPNKDYEYADTYKSLGMLATNPRGTGFILVSCPNRLSTSRVQRYIASMLAIAMC